MTRLQDWTTARVGLGVVGHACPTQPHLELRLAQARARDAVHAPFNTRSLVESLNEQGWPSQVLHSRAQDRAEYLRRPDLGRHLEERSREVVNGFARANWETAFVLADGLSARAVERHAAPLLRGLLTGGMRGADAAHPIWIVEEGRVAIGDAVGELLRADLVVVLIGERPGLSSPDSLGIYLTWQPRKGRTDAERNCISNIHGQGLSYTAAAHKLMFLMSEARQRKLSGVPLKDLAPLTLE